MRTKRCIGWFHTVYSMITTIGIYLISLLRDITSVLAYQIKRRDDKFSYLSRTYSSSYTYEKDVKIGEETSMRRCQHIKKITNEKKTKINE